MQNGGRASSDLYSTRTIDSTMRRSVVVLKAWRLLETEAIISSSTTATCQRHIVSSAITQPASCSLFQGTRYESWKHEICLRACSTSFLTGPQVQYIRAASAPASTDPIMTGHKQMCTVYHRAPSSQKHTDSNDSDTHLAGADSAASSSEPNGEPAGVAWHCSNHHCSHYNPLQHPLNVP